MPHFCWGLTWGFPLCGSALFLSAPGRDTGSECLSLPSPARTGEARPDGREALVAPGVFLSSSAGLGPGRFEVENWGMG